MYPCVVSSRRRPAAYLIVPAITLAVAVSSLLAFATPRTLVAARLWGGPTVEGPQFLRLQCVRRAVGVEDGVALEKLTVEIDGAKHEASCDARGHGEISIQPARSGRFSLRVLRGSEVLAEGDSQVTEAEWKAGAISLPARVASSGTLPVQALVVGGSLLLERWGEVVLVLPEELRAPGRLKLSASGLALLPTSSHPRGLLVRVKPTFFTAVLSAEDGAGGSWEARLPVRMSGVAAEEISIKEGHLRGHLRAATAAPVAYVQVQDQRGRIAAASIPLLSDGNGGAHAPFDLALPPRRGASWLLTSTWPQPSEDGAIPWSLAPEPDALDGRVVPDLLWVDGMKPAVGRESERLRRRLGAVGLVVLLGALTEALLLYERARAARIAFQKHLAELGEGGQETQLSEAHGGLRVALAAAVVLFGFAVIGAVLVAQIE